jgi:signal transduction histidine kinase
MSYTVCRDIDHLCDEIKRGAGLALLTEEAIDSDRQGHLQSVLSEQPAWSDFPFVVLAREHERGQLIRESMNATLVERPVKVRSLISVIRAALRSRRHQYQVREHLAERHRLEADLREADRKKDDFIALLAHELRNPLAPIRNGLQVLQLASTDEAIKGNALEIMERQLSHMVRLIDDLLDVSRINRNKLELRREHVNLLTVVMAAVETARPIIDAERHELSISFPETALYVDADPVRLAQVFNNLLTNSAKFTPRGGQICLTVEPGDGSVQVAVKDTGIGIPATALETIFDMFSQIDPSIERSTGGLGIGLALVKGLVEAHGGSIAAESAGRGQGATFTVTLPVVAERTPAPVNGQSHNPEFNGRLRVLVVDDNTDGAESLRMVLSLMGNEVETAKDGVDAIERAEEFRPDVILMDIGMPRLNGYEATRLIRQRDWGKGIYIIALTGWGQLHDRERAKKAGCDAHLVKPVHRPALEEQLMRLCK